MNLLYGCVGPDTEQAWRRLDNAVRSTIGVEGGATHTATADHRLGSHSDGGCLIGTHDAGPVAVTALGAFLSSSVNPALAGPEASTVARGLADRLGSGTIDVLGDLHGQYALAAFDRAHNRLILATDPGGLRTLYHTTVNETLYYSTHLGTLATALGDQLELDRSYEDFLLSYGFTPNGHTCYRGITEVPTSKALVWERGTVTTVPIGHRDPWRDSFNTATLDTDATDTAIGCMEEAFMAAMVEIAHPSERAAVLLGGVDSALVAAALQRLGKQVETFSFFYEDSRLNQSHTDTLANYLGINHTWFPITAEIIADGLDHYRDRFNRPTNWPNYLIQTEALCRSIREAGYEACYSGDGCDGAFLGYPRTHVVARFLDSSFRLPWPLLGLVEKVAGPALVERSIGRPYRVAMNMLRNLARRPPARGFIPFRNLDDLTLRHLRADDRPSPSHDVDDVLEELAAAFGDLSADRRAYKGKGIVGVNKKIGRASCRERV